MAKAFLEVQDLEAWALGKTILHRVTFSADRNRLLTVIGPRGSGKSTLLRCLNRLFEEKPGHGCRGHIYLEGEDLMADGVDSLLLRRRLAMLFPQPTCFRNLSLFENVAFALRIQGIESGTEIGQAVEAALVSVHLWDRFRDRLHRSVADLQPSEQQLICLARALAIRPQILLLDEPTSQIGLQMTMQFEQLLRELAQSTSILMTTSSRKQAARISDRTAFLLDGELVEIGKTSDLFMNPKDSRTEDFLTGRFG